MKTTKQLNNTQKLNKAIKEIDSLGALGSTVFLIEVVSAIESRLDLLTDLNNIYKNPIYSRSQAIKVLIEFLKQVDLNN